MRILALSPHADDVELGAGGTLARMRQEGHEVHWVVLSTAGESQGGTDGDDRLAREFAASAEVLGVPVRARQVCGYRVRRFGERRQDLLEDLVGLRRDLQPGMVLAPAGSDVHQDHAVVAAEVVRAFKGQATILGYQLPWNQLQPRFTGHVRLQPEHLSTKQRMLACYASQRGKPYFDPAFIEGWARFAGVQAGCTYAESFEVVRWVL